MFRWFFFLRRHIAKKMSPLEQAFNAVSDGNINALVRMINALPSFINRDNNRTLLYEACEGGHLEIVKLLLNVSGIDVNKGVSIVSI